MISGEGKGEEFRGVGINAVLESEKDSARVCVCVYACSETKMANTGEVGAGEYNKNYEEQEPNSKK